jgi:hypothetical protein
MFKRMFQFSASETEPILTGRNTRNGSTAQPSGVVKLSNALQRESEGRGHGIAGVVKAMPAALEPFEDIYTVAGIHAQGQSYSILKVAEMLKSKHLTDMTPDSKRNSLMMALEAAGAEIGGLLQDAVSRNRALDEYEEKRQEYIKTFELTKAQENNKLHAELEQINSQYMARIQSNSDEVAQEQDKFGAWQKRKQQESQRITDAATFCVPQGNSSNGTAGSLTAVLERVALPRR